MSVKIRRQSILSTVVIYFGFAVGLLNTYFFTKQGLFTAEQYGLTSFFIATVTLMASFASFAMPSFIFKFYPYYNDNLKPQKNDMITISLVISLIGFTIILIAGLIFKDLVYRKYSGNSLLFVQFYYWLFPMALGLTIYNVLEAYAWSLQKSVLTNFLKEVEWRLFTTVLIVLFIFKIIPDFDLFMKLFAFSYPAIAVTLFLYLLLTKKIHLTFKLSKVTKRLSKSIVRFCSFIFGAQLVFTLSQVFDTMVIASVLPNGLDKAGIFGLAQILTSVIQAPQRGITAAAVPHLAQAWKDKKVATIQRIYQRSSINLLIFSCLIYILILVNYKEAINTLHLKPAYLLGFNAFILLGLTRIVDMGTGVNAQIIGTSRYWRFELTSGIILLALMIPLNYFLTKQFDIVGPAYANFISISIYNIIRIIFLWKKYKLFPFTAKSFYTLLLSAAVLAIGYYAFANIHGWLGMIVRSTVMLALFAIGVVLLKLTPDLRPVLQSLLNRYPFRNTPKNLNS